MDSLDNRQKAFENKFMHDEQVHFKATAAAVKAVAADVASHSGHADPAAYAKEITFTVLIEDGPQAALKQILADAAGKGRPIDAEALQAQFEKAQNAEMKRLMND